MAKHLKFDKGAFERGRRGSDSQPGHNRQKRRTLTSQYMYVATALPDLYLTVLIQLADLRRGSCTCKTSMHSFIYSMDDGHQRFAFGFVLLIMFVCTNTVRSVTPTQITIYVVRAAACHGPIEAENIVS